MAAVCSYRDVALAALREYLSMHRGSCASVTLPKLRRLGLVPHGLANGVKARYLHDAILALRGEPVRDALGNLWVLGAVRVRRKTERGKYVYFFRRVDGPG